MICPVCKCENAEGARVCAICGAQIPEQNQSVNSPANASSPAKRPKIPKIVLPIVAVAVLIAVVLIACLTVFFGGKRDSYTFFKQNVTCFYNNAAHRQATVFVNGEPVGQIEGLIGYSLTSNDNIVTMFLVLNEDSDYYLSAYALNGRKLVKIKDFTSLSDIKLSSSGKKIAYTDFDTEESEMVLYLYDTGKGRSEKIDSAYYISDIVLSPDGETLTYSVRKGGLDDGETICCFYNGKKRVELGKDVNPIALSKDGKYIYSLSEDEDGSSTIVLYNKSGNKVREIGKPTKRTLFFNDDNTELLYTVDDFTYISVNGEVGSRFFEAGGVYPIMPANNTKPSNPTFVEGNVITVPIDSFYDKFYRFDGGIYQVKKNSDDPIMLASEVTSACCLSEDASRIYYMDVNSDLKMIRTSWGANAPEKAVTIAEDVVNFVFTSNYSRVYYRDRNGLYSANGNTGASKVLITEEATTSLMLGKGDILYFRLDSDLYACSDGRNATMVLSDTDSNVNGGSLGYLYFQSDDTIYCTTGSERPKKILTIAD